MDTLKDFIKKCMIENIGQSDMYNFIKNHTNNFNKTSLEFLKNDLNNYTKKIDFTLINEIIHKDGSIEQTDSNTNIENYIENFFDFSEVDVFDFPVLRTPRMKLNFVLNDIEEKGTNFVVKGIKYGIIGDEYLGFFNFCDIVIEQYYKITNPKIFFFDKYGILPDVIPDFKEMQYQINSLPEYKEKQNIIAYFYNTFSYFKMKCNSWKEKNNGILPNDLINFLNELKTDFKIYFPNHGRIEGVYYFDDIVEMYLIENQNIQTLEPKPFNGLLKELSDKQLNKLFDILTTGYKYTIENIEHTKNIKFIDTDINTFKYVFGSKDKPENFQPIKFLGNKQILRQILTELQQEIKYNQKHPETRELSNEIARQTQIFFIDNKNKPFELANNDNRKSNPKLIHYILATI